MTEKEQTRGYREREEVRADPGVGDEEDGTIMHKVNKLQGYTHNKKSEKHPYTKYNYIFQFIYEVFQVYHRPRVF